MSDKVKIKLFNTLSRKKEELVPLDNKYVTFYSCGQTVYEDVHVGNAKTYIVWDLLTRVLKHFGYKVKHVQNFTDVGHLTDDGDGGEDKIAQRARELKEHPMELVDRQIHGYYEAVEKINLNRPNLAPRATSHITEMIDLVEKLIQNGHGYILEGSVYFDISTFDDYGKMAKLDLENLKAGARIKLNQNKRNPGDFALWIKAPKEHIMQYSSPWGLGYPGWHLECSVMAMKYLGETIDIHAGGFDHIPVHHTNEIAQSEGATGRKFAQIWLHSAFITVDGAKMSKSKNNFFTLNEFVDEVGSGAGRLTLMQSHYRTQADFSMKQARQVKKRYNRLIRSFHYAQQQLVINGDELVFDNNFQSTKYMLNFNKALADDLNTPIAIAQLNSVANNMETAIKNKMYDKLKHFMKEFELMMNVLGIHLPNLTAEEIHQVEKILHLRIDLKSENKLEASDTIRSFLQGRGYIIQDQSDGDFRWYKIDL